MSNLDVVAGYAPSIMTYRPTPLVTPPLPPPQVYIAPGSINQYTTTPGTIINVPISKTTYVWLLSSGLVVYSLNPFPSSGVYQIAVVVCDQYGISSITDVRPLGAFSFGTGGGSFSGPGLPGVVPTGAIDGTNTTYILPTIPTAGGLFQVFRNIGFQVPGVDYTVSGATITYLYPPSGSIQNPPNGDSIIVFYT